MLVHFSYNPKLINKPPDIKSIPYVAHRAIWRRINGQFINKRGRPETLAKLIQQGHPYTATHRRYRHEKNFVNGQVLSLDFDDNGSFDHLLSDVFIVNNASFIYSTPSSTREHPRSRVVFTLTKPVDNPVLFGAMQTALVLKYKEADKSCKDPVRIFFGSKDCDLHFLNNVLSTDEMADMAKDILVKEKENSKKGIVDASRLSNDTIRRQIELQLSKIQSASDGERHIARIKACKTIGGYVAAGYIDFSTAFDLSLAAASVNTSSHIAAIQHDVECGLNYGMTSPLPIEPQSFEDYGIFI